MEPAGGDPGTMKRRLAAVNLGLARPRFALSALAWMGDPSALPAMKVCLFSNPGLWTTGREPERPAPSLLQDVLGYAAGRSSDRVRYSPGTVPNSRHSEVGGRPQARATLGKRDIGTSAFTIN